MEKRLESFIVSGHPVIWIESSEEARVDGMLSVIFKRLKKRRKEDPNLPMQRVIHWSVSAGWDPTWPKGGKRPKGPVHQELSDALVSVLKSDDGTTLVLREPDLYRLSGYSEAGKVRRLLRDCCRYFPKERKTLIMVSAVAQVPGELEREVAVLRVPLPGRGELGEVLDALAKKNGVTIKGAERERVVAAALGLTTNEADNVFSLSLVEKGEFRPETVAKEKVAAISRSPALSVVDTTGLPEVGGMEGLKEWLVRHGKMYSPEARRVGLRPPRGILLVGPPGTGKSMMAKQIASDWQLPLVRFDVGSTLHGVVGSSEAAMRRALETASVMAPAVLLIDEINRAFAGVSGSSAGLDSGVKAGLFGQFLVWAQERTEPVFVVGTLNDVEGVPPALMRQGRFDAVFFVDLPNEKEREKILRIYLDKWDPLLWGGKKFAKLIKEGMQGFSGAEIAGAVREANVRTFAEKGRGSCDLQELMVEVKAMVPMLRLTPKKIQALQEWGEKVRPASR